MAAESTFRRIMVLWLKVVGIIVGIGAILAILVAPIVLTIAFGPEWSVVLGFAGTIALCVLFGVIVHVLDENPDFMA